MVKYSAQINFGFMLGGHFHIHALIIFYSNMLLCVSAAHMKFHKPKAIRCI